MNALGLILLVLLGLVIGLVIGSGLVLLRKVRPQPRVKADPFVDERFSRIQSM